MGRRKKSKVVNIKKENTLISNNITTVVPIEPENIIKVDDNTKPENITQEDCTEDEERYIR